MFSIRGIFVGKRILVNDEVFCVQDVTTITSAGVELLGRFNPDENQDTFKKVFFTIDEEIIYAA